MRVSWSFLGGHSGSLDRTVSLVDMFWATKTGILYVLAAARYLICHNQGAQKIIDTRILQTMVPGIPPACLGNQNLYDPCIYVVFWGPNNPKRSTATIALLVAQEEIEARFRPDRLAVVGA